MQRRVADNLQINSHSVSQAWHLLINDALAIGDTEDIGFFLGAEDSWAGDWLQVQNSVNLPVDRKS